MFVRAFTSIPPNCVSGVFISRQMTRFNSYPFTNLLDPPILPLCTTNLEAKLK
ncbi:hypothetical protein HanIR_Chr03g0105111 [Helianthus annuus]|nr:hypothetical protein HanIR_Chr03g0105111 [Helianthus annuus]